MIDTLFLLLIVTIFYISYKAKKKEKKIIYIILIISLLLLLFLNLNGCLRYKYPTFDKLYEFFFTTVLFLLPTLIYYIYYKTKEDNRFIYISFLIVNTFCWIYIGIFSLLMFAFGGFFKSETTNINNYLKFDDDYINASFFPKKLDDFNVVFYYYSFTHTLDYRYEVYLEVKTDNDKYQEIFNEISNNSKLVLDNDKKYYAIGDKNLINNDYKDIHLVIFGKDNTIIYQRAFAQYNDKTIPHNISIDDYNKIYDFFNNPKGYNKYENLGTDILTNHGAKIMSINKTKDCIPVTLTLYDDNQYELFTDYEACNPNNDCNKLDTKSIKGTYDYDVLKILEEDNIDDKLYYSKEETPEYKIFVGDYYVREKNHNYYSVKKGTSNKALNELLNTIDIDLDSCATPDYN